tara:strand:- start:404 stop:838 length:435 start_codon:yes stop_codon:yes gene_type:complete
MNILRISNSQTPEAKELVQQFVDGAGKSLSSFSYFENRSLDVLQNHIVTLLGYEGDKPIAYGHLDLDENGIVWLGVAISEGFTGLGYGEKMVRDLIRCGNDAGSLKEITLSVYKDNIPAQKLYEKLNFVKVSENDKSFFYKLIL